MKKTISQHNTILQKLVYHQGKRGSSVPYVSFSFHAPKGHDTVEVIEAWHEYSEVHGIEGMGSEYLDDLITFGLPAKTPIEDIVNTFLYALDSSPHKISTTEHVDYTHEFYKKLNEIPSVEVGELVVFTSNLGTTYIVKKEA